MAKDTLENDIDIQIQKPPFDLSGRSLQIWNEVFKLLSAENKLKVVDHWLIARYCETQSEWENLNKFRQQNEIFKEMTSSKGVKYFAKHPQISRLETIEQLLLRLEKQLGIGSSGSGDGPGGTDKVQDAIKKILARSS